MSERVLPGLVTDLARVMTDVGIARFLTKPHPMLDLATPLEVLSDGDSGEIARLRELVGSIVDGSAA